MRTALLVAGLATACGGRVGEEPAPSPADTAVEVGLADTSLVMDDTAVVADAPRETTVDSADAVACDAGLLRSTQCSNGIDDDGDGLVDWLDPECLSVIDNDESAFPFGIVDEFFDPCKLDCAFDGNGGSGDDGCAFDGRCLVGNTNPRCPYDPVRAADATLCPKMPEKCVKYCGARTPNGCDCSGCCDVYDSTGASRRARVYASGCTFEKLNDPAYCPPCEKQTECDRPCGRCDYCLGKTKLPSDCAKPTCPTGARSCDPETPCACGEFCLTGCCVKG